MRQFFEQLEEYFVSLLLAAMTGLASVNVFYRYVLEDSIDWAFELNTFFFGFLIFIGASWGLRIGAHIGVDTFVKLLPPALNRAAGILAVLLGIVYAAIVMYGGYTYVEKMYDIGIMSQDIQFIPQWVPRAALPIGYALILFRLVELLIAVLKGERNGYALIDEAHDAMESFAEEKKEARS